MVFSLFWNSHIGVFWAVLQIGIALMTQSAVLVTPGNKSCPAGYHPADRIGRIALQVLWQKLHTASTFAKAHRLISWRRNISTSIIPHILVAQVIRHNNNKVGLILYLFSSKRLEGHASTNSVEKIFMVDSVRFLKVFHRELINAGELSFLN